MPSIPHPEPGLAFNNTSQITLDLDIFFEGLSSHVLQIGVLLLVVLPAVLAKVGEAGSGKRVPKQVHTKGEYHFPTKHSHWIQEMLVAARNSGLELGDSMC